MITTSIDLYLASQSPRRSQLLQQIGIRFAVVRVDVVEQQQAGETPLDYVRRLACEKAQAGANVVHDAPVLGADTVVVAGECLLEKPSDQYQAVDMLLGLSEATHEVMTAVAVSFKDKTEVRVNSTQVCFRKITPEQAERYWLTGEPSDKAGGYGIQGLGAVFVKQIRGSYSAVVGLPLLETAELLEMFEVPIWQG